MTGKQDEMARHKFFDDWMDRQRPLPTVEELVVLHEKDGARAGVEQAIQQAALDHLIGLKILGDIGGFEETAAFIRNKLPTEKRVMSGDLGEILASEYIEQCTEFSVPVKRLRWKDDRNTTMRGNDVIAVQRKRDRWRLLKAEAKSQADLRKSTVEQAVAGLSKHSGRPNPSSLAFISSRLREEERHDEAAVFEGFQTIPPDQDDLEHLVFTFSGSDPTGHLETHAAAGGGILRHLVGCVVPDHQQFIRRTFETLNVRDS